MDDQILFEALEKVCKSRKKRLIFKNFLIKIMETTEIEKKIEQKVKPVIKFLTIAEKLAQKKKEEMAKIFTFKNVTDVVAEYHGMESRHVKLISRKRVFVGPRQICMRIMADYSGKSLKVIGKHYGGKDHATVIHSKQVVQNSMDTDEEYLYHFNNIVETLDPERKYTNIEK